MGVLSYTLCIAPQPPYPKTSSYAAALHMVKCSSVVSGAMAERDYFVNEQPCFLEHIIITDLTVTAKFILVKFCHVCAYMCAVLMTRGMFSELDP